jgi:hypothetical protein
MKLITRWSSLSHSCFAFFSLRVTWRLTKGIETVSEREVLGMGWADCLIGIGGRTVSGEKTRGEGGCRRGEAESAMAKKGDELDSRRQQKTAIRDVAFGGGT